MNVALAYRGRSSLITTGLDAQLRFAANLSRAPVSFDAAVRRPLRFREAISALHDIVISDLRFERSVTEKAAYLAWKENERQRLLAVRKEVFKKAREEVLVQHEIAPEFEKQFNRCRSRYWSARQNYANYLREHDAALWRKLMPCDPVVTVADDVVFFECFSSDESSYGCLTVEREAGFHPSQAIQFGTTNVDYSWDLYHHFQDLRTYRETRLRVDPEGVEVQSGQAEQYREEKIDLPTGWLRGLLQIQVAMCLPLRKVRLSREAVYNVIAWLKRHRAWKSPRAMRFELQSGRSPRMVLEPWEQEIVSHGTTYDGPQDDPIRIWGTRRLLTLARVLPFAESFDVYLLGTGLPSFWVARMGEMRLTLGLSGWTANDWTHGSALDTLLPAEPPRANLISNAAELLQREPAMSFERMRSQLLTDPAPAAAALNHLARTGQVIYDLDARVYRRRQIMSQALGEADLGPPNPESVAALDFIRRKQVSINSRDVTQQGRQVVRGKVENQVAEVSLDADGVIRAGKCRCSVHFKNGIRQGACRHLLALRMSAQAGEEVSALSWFERLRKRANN